MSSKRKAPEDFGGSWSETYSKQCVCGRLVEVATQPDNRPDYYTTVCVRCTCGKSVEFRLPVN